MSSQGEMSCEHRLIIKDCLERKERTFLTIAPSWLKHHFKNR